MSQILTSSITISLLRRFYNWYVHIGQSLIDIYSNNQSYALLNKFWGKTKIYFRYSFLGRISEIGQISSGVLDNSRAVQSLINLCKRWKGKIIYYSRNSLIVEQTKDAKEELCLFPVKTISIIVVSAIVANVLCSIVLQSQIALRGWLIRGLFLFAGLFCLADGQTIKKNSLILRKTQK